MKRKSNIDSLYKNPFGTILQGESEYTEPEINFDDLIKENTRLKIENCNLKLLIERIKKETKLSEIKKLLKWD